MKWVWRGLLALLAVVAILAVIVVVRTNSATQAANAGAAIEIAEAPAIDADAAAQHLSRAIQFRTISITEGVVDNPEQFQQFQAWLAETYPLTHAAFTREMVAGHSMLYTLAGSDPSLAPVLLMAHQDVVPVEEGTEGDWDAPPFDGIIRDGEIIGRGAMDDKGSLIGIFEGTEAVLRAGFQPRRGVILFFGHDEETLGGGARAAAALLRERNIRPWFVLDEGGAVILDNDTVGGPAAFIGIAEKGYLTVHLTARAEGGHSSRPLRDSAAERLSRAILAVRGNPFPARLDGAPLAMTRALSRDAGFVERAALANLWLFRPLVEQRVGATPEGDAMLRTTIAPTMIQGGTKENILPQQMVATVNLRLHPRDTIDSALAHLRRSVAGIEGVTVEVHGTPTNPSAVSDVESDSFRLIEAMAQRHSPENAPVTPYLVGGATDSRYFADVAENVYRFAPAWARTSELSRAHGTDERLSVENLERMARFYAELLMTSTR
ncbi:MAG: M20 family peptidase [Hyphomonadaceae bacterium]